MIELLSFLKDKKYSSQFIKWIDDSSYSVAGAALQGLVMLDPENGYHLAKKHSNDAKGKLASIISQILMVRGTESDLEKISELYIKLNQPVIKKSYLVVYIPFT